MKHTCYRSNVSKKSTTDEYYLNGIREDYCHACSLNYKLMHPTFLEARADLSKAWHAFFWALAESVRAPQMVSWLDKQLRKATWLHRRLSVKR